MPNFFYGTYNSITAYFAGTGNATPSSATIYVKPLSTSLSTNTYFTYFGQPVTSGSGTTASTVVIENSPSGGTITNAYALNIVSGKIFSGDSTNSISTTSGAVVVSGGVGIGGDLYVGGTIHGTVSGSSTLGSITLTNATNQIILGTTNTTTISSVAPAASRIYTIPDANSNTSFILGASSAGQTLAGGLTSSGLLTASNGLSLTTGALNLSSTSGTISCLNTLISTNSRILFSTTAAVNVSLSTSYIELNDNPIFIRNDKNHYLSYANASGGSFASLSIDGPVLAGFEGGVLGCTSGGDNWNMRWTVNGQSYFRNNLTAENGFDANGSIAITSTSGTINLSGTPLLTTSNISLMPVKATSATSSSSSIVLNSNPLYLRGNIFNYLVFANISGGSFAGQAVEGPALAGQFGGILGTSDGGQNWSMKWDSSGNSTFNSVVQGSSSSSVDFSSSSGIFKTTTGLTSITGPLQRTTRSISANTTLSASSGAHFIIVTANTITITLPTIYNSSGNNGITFFIVNFGTGTVTVTVGTPANEAFDANTDYTSLSLLQNDRMHIIGYGNGSSIGYWYTF